MNAEASRHPYQSLPEERLWRSAVSERVWTALEPGCINGFRIQPGEKLASLGSCFAANVVKHLRKQGHPVFFAEQAPTAMSVKDAEARSYFEFSVRAGNVYTSAQLVELFEQALGLRAPIEDFYTAADGSVFDLLRPSIEPGGYASLHEAKADRLHHLQCVKRMIERMQVFVFTMGLTEGWKHRSRGFHYPVCPGTVAGRFDASQHAPVQLRFTEVLSQMQRVVSLIRSKNPACKIVLTVSPVALSATHQARHVLVATLGAKSVLRAVAEELCQQDPGICYFPSYELIASAASMGQFLDESLRGANQRGIGHVMQVFEQSFGLRHSLATLSAPGSVGLNEKVQISAIAQPQVIDLTGLAEALCDESWLDPWFGEHAVLQNGDRQS